MNNLLKEVLTVGVQCGQGVFEERCEVLKKLFHSWNSNSKVDIVKVQTNVQGIVEEYEDSSKEDIEGQVLPPDVSPSRADSSVNEQAELLKCDEYDLGPQEETISLMTTLLNTLDEEGKVIEGEDNSEHSTVDSVSHIVDDPLGGEIQDFQIEETEGQCLRRDSCDVREHVEVVDGLQQPKPVMQTTAVFRKSIR